MPAQAAENLTDNQEIKLKELLEYNLKSIRAHLLRELFQQFWDDVSPTWAGRFLDTWCTSAMRSRLAPMKKVAKSLRRHRLRHDRAASSPTSSGGCSS